ncbi:MAG: hypothetical protein ACRDI2_24060 [Chloroflexota bacterium]
MPGWQQFYAQHAGEGFELVSVAVEVQGAEAARPWLERAGATFPTLVDAANALGEVCGYKAIPNGIVLDEGGVVRFQKLGGFSVSNAEDVAAVERLLGEGGASGATPAPAGLARGEARVSALQRGLDRLRQGDRTGAVDAWRAALAADPDNYVIRKQIWAVEHPERFYPTIDWAWQKEQLARERAAQS